RRVAVAQMGPVGDHRKPHRRRRQYWRRTGRQIRSGRLHVAATQGNGTTSQLTSEMFQMMAHVKLQNVPYRGSAPALNDLIAGSVDCMFDNLGVSLQLVKAGKLKLIAVASPQRMASLPDVPTIAATLPGFESVTWYAVVAPPRAPAAVV